jgi:hypothetical protein
MIACHLTFVPAIPLQHCKGEDFQDLSTEINWTYTNIKLQTQPIRFNRDHAQKLSQRPNITKSIGKYDQSHQITRLERLN